MTIFKPQNRRGMELFVIKYCVGVVVAEEKMIRNVPLTEQF